MKKLLILLLLTGLGFLTGTFFRPAHCGAACELQLDTVAPLEFSRQLSERDVILLDVRTASEYAEGHIANAINIDFNKTEQFVTYLDSLDTQKKYHIYCRSGNRSRQALQLMKTKGFSKIVNLEGGIQAWQSAGFSLKEN